MMELPKASKQAPPRPCVMRVVRVSGTIKKAEEEAIRRARAAILRARMDDGEGSTDGLSAILDQLDQGSRSGRSEGIGSGILAGFENDDEEDPESGTDDNG